MVQKLVDTHLNSGYHAKFNELCQTKVSTAEILFFVGVQHYYPAVSSTLEDSTSLKLDVVVCTQQRSKHKTLVEATHTVHSAMDCGITATRDLNGQKVSFHAHPRFTRIVQLWGGNGRYNTTRSFYRQQVAATRTQIGKDTRDAAVNKAVQTAGSLWPGLQLIQWSELHNIPGITVYTARTLLRLKANRLSMWNYEKADLSCSNPECSQVVQSSVQHLFWECPKAKLVWNYFYALWAKIGITPGHDPAIWIFSLDLPDTPRHAWTTIKRHIIGHKFSNEHLQDHLYPVAHMLWRYMSASLIHAIWCAHLRRMDSDPIESTAEMAIMMTRLEAGMRNLTRLAEAQAGDSDGHTVAAVLKAYVDCFLSQTDAIPLTPSDTRGVYLLFFDGGSRGNPGPGGTGSIIVRVHKDSHTASLIWTASMAYSRKDTTNNLAEYWGLIHGLREAQRSHFEPLYVIGDSALIISQQRMHRSPRQHRLARLYQTSRRLADCIDIRGWYHHYRAFNKMADSAANLAMDTRTSTQVHFLTHRAAFNNLTQDLDNDVMHWLMRNKDGSWSGRKVFVYLVRETNRVPVCRIESQGYDIGTVRANDKSAQPETAAVGCESSVEVLNVPLIAQTQRVVAIDPSFCKSRVATLQVQRDFLSTTTTIRELTTDADVFVTKSSAFSSRKTLLNQDKSPIVNCKIKSGLFSRKPIYHVYARDIQRMELFEIYAKYGCRDRTELCVETTDAFTDRHYSFDLKGDWYHRNAFIWLERNRSGIREPVARVHCPKGVARIDYHLDVAPNVDIALMVMICDALTMEEDAMENSTSSRTAVADAHSVACMNAASSACTSAAVDCAM
ncbi:reverse transcriptase, partial [Globisporangium splendens]